MIESKSDTLFTMNYEAAVPLRIAVPVENGMTSVTATKEGFPYPVGTPVPVAEYSKKLQNK